MIQQILSILFTLLGVLMFYLLVVRLLDGPIQLTGYWLARCLTLFSCSISPRIALALGLMFWLSLGVVLMALNPQ